MNRPQRCVPILFIVLLSLMLTLAFMREGQTAGALTSGNLGDVAAASFHGGTSGDDAGRSVASAGDVNNDGFADFLVGVPGDDSVELDVGAVYLILGSAMLSNTGVNLSEPSPGIIRYTGAGLASGDTAGTSVAGVGDVNNDGFDDFVVGSPKDDPGGINSGAVYLVLGSAAPISSSLSSHIQFAGTAGVRAGESVAGAGDVNNDGFADFLVGAPADGEAGVAAGAAYLVLGSAAPAAGSLVAHIKYTGEGIGDEAGESVAGAGDINGDGFDDLLVGAPGNVDAGNFSGAAYLILGSDAPLSSSLAAHVQYTGANGEEAGRSVGGAWDINNDGFDDFLVGAPANSAGGPASGAAYLVLGSGIPLSGTLATHIRYTGEASSNQAGAAVGGAGDINNDGFGDFLVGAPSNAAAGSSSGAAHLVLGSATPVSSSLGAHIRYTGEAGGDRAGDAVAAAGDVNNDGFDDFLVGAPLHDRLTGNGGAAYLVLGDTTEPVEHELAVSLAGDGSGTVTSNPAGINCGVDCSETYREGTVVTLTVVANGGSVFAGWSGHCTGTSDCVVTMDGNRVVTATFATEPEPAEHLLTVALAGVGSGTVTSDPEGIDCGVDCTESYLSGTAVSLTAVADSGSTFVGWSGHCTGAGDCVVTMDEARAVTAAFDLEPVAESYELYLPISIGY